MAEFNLMVGASTDFAAEAKALLRPGVDANREPIPPTPAVSFPLLNSLSQDTQDTLNGQHDGDTVQRIFNSWSPGNGKTYRVYSFYTNKPDNPSAVILDFNALASAYPTDFRVM